jgi:hypothetical protein
VRELARVAKPTARDRFLDVQLDLDAILTAMHR